MRVLIDGDIIVYSAGFAAEKHSYKTDDGAVFDYVKQAKEHSDRMGLDKDAIERLVDPEPLSHCLHNVSSMVKNIIAQTGADEHLIFISGPNNFRDDVATIKPYKGNRDATFKPYHKDAIIEYLKKNWNTEVADGVEADDMMGIYQDIDTCIATIDKDLDMIPGEHYNWRKDSLYYVSSKDALYNFYQQLLTGDSIDNIPGVPNIGEKRAQRILAPHDNEEDYYWAVLEAYEKAYELPMLALQENADLLWIQQSDQLRWEPPA